MSPGRGQPRDTAPAGQPAELPPAASLLSVPIFRAAAHQQAAREPAAGHRGSRPQARREPPPSPAPAPHPPGPAEARTTGSTPYAVVGGTAQEPAGPEAATPPVADALPAAPPAGTEDRAGRPRAPALHAVDGPQSYRTLLDYWRSLARQGRAPVAKLDAQLIAARWPYTMLLRVPRGGVVDIVQVYAPDAPDAAAAVVGGAGAGATGAQHPFARDQASQISSWVLEIAQDAAGSRQPSRHSETFHQAGRPRRLTAELLPCQADGDSADHLLLQLRDG
jgi:nucleotide-binding universal stress UspA family protein